MLKNIRLVVLDYPKLIIKNNDVKNVLADMIQAKQVNFERSDMSYVPLSGLDMISTHFLIYDTSDIYKPKPILAMRNCYESRSKTHKVPLPVESYMPAAPQSMQAAWQKFKSDKSNIVDCNAWFVDPEYSFKKTGIPLSDVGFFMVAAHILRMGMDHLVGVANEKFKASRWVEPIGEFPKKLEFNHPLMEVIHSLILLEPFNKKWFADNYKKYESLYTNRVELMPDGHVSQEKVMDDKWLKMLVQGWSNDIKTDARELDLVS